MLKPFLLCAAAIASAVLTVACTEADAAPPSVPDNLRPSVGQVLSLEALAKGFQLYECTAAKGDATRFEWTFVAPEAELFDRAGSRIGKHYAGPTWEIGDQGIVVGEVSARDDGPDSSAIPWLLLKAKSASGSGVLGRTQSVQRLQTVGGKAPVAGCDRERAGITARVPYQATYYFYAPRT